VGVALVGLASVLPPSYGKMSKELSARTVGRFFQIDRKLDAAVDVALAPNSPLMH